MPTVHVCFISLNTDERENRIPDQVPVTFPGLTRTTAVKTSIGRNLGSGVTTYGIGLHIDKVSLRIFWMVTSFLPYVTTLANMILVSTHVLKCEPM